MFGLQCMLKLKGVLIYLVKIHGEAQRCINMFGLQCMVRPTDSVGFEKNMAYLMVKPEYVSIYLVYNA